MFPGRSTFFIFYGQNRPANGSPFGRAGAKRLRGQGRKQKGYLMINGVIFDMDGLMFDTERMWATFWEPALAALGLPYKEGLSEAARGTAGETLRNVVHQFYGQDCNAAAIVDSLHTVADKAFQKPVPKKPGLDELLAWLDEQHIPMAVASSSRMDVIQRNLDNWGMRHYFSVLASGQQVTRSKPDPEIFLLAAEKLGMVEVPCVCVDDLAPEQVNALRLVDNKSNESPWDLDLLGAELPELDLSAFDFEWGLPDKSPLALDDDEPADSGNRQLLHCPKCGFAFEVDA